MHRGERRIFGQKMPAKCAKKSRKFSQKNQFQVSPHLEPCLPSRFSVFKLPRTSSWSSGNISSRLSFNSNVVSSFNFPKFCGILLIELWLSARLCNRRSGQSTFGSKCVSKLCDMSSFKSRWRWPMSSASGDLMPLWLRSSILRLCSFPSPCGQSGPRSFLLRSSEVWT